MTEKDEIVWVLGAGFSAALGGPLLKDLLSLRQRDMLWHRFPSLVRWDGDRPADGRENEPKTDAVYTLYHCGLGFPEGHPYRRGLPTDLGERMWEHAEDFLDYLDTAAAYPAARARLEQMWTSYWEREYGASRHPTEAVKFALPAADALLSHAKRLVAAECSLFAFEGAEKMEKWAPFHTWARGLTGSDSIVTFNYDRVLEILAFDESARLSDKASVAVGRYDNQFREEADCAEVLKLHGSVDWSLMSNRTPHGAFGVPDDPLPFERGRVDEAIRCNDSSIAIATPGPTKHNLATGEFAPLWDRARERLQHADAIVFVGYRFPPTDAKAREHILSAIESNVRPHLDLHVVLGPERNEHVVRLEEMLRYAARRSKRNEMPTTHVKTKSFRIVTHALWAQDFMQLVSRRDLIWPSKANPRWGGKGRPE